MLTNIIEEIPETVRNDIFDIVTKDDKLYVILKEDKKDCEMAISKIFSNEDMEFLDLFELMKNRLLKDLSDSVSLLDNEPLVDRMGLQQMTEIFYDLTNLQQSKKMLFNYALLGRRGVEGLLQRLGGGRLTKSAVFVPSNKEDEVEDFIKGWDVEYTKRSILIFEEGGKL
jgi:hypothetical protein